MNSNQNFTTPSAEESRMMRLTCEWKPEEDHSFNFDDLIVDDEIFVAVDQSAVDQSVVVVQSEADVFNALYGTHYTQENFDKFTNYREHYGKPNGLTVEDAIEYIQTCHCCNEQLDTFAGEYCSGGCHNHVEELGLPCFRGAGCLICNKQSFMRYCLDTSASSPEPTPTFCSDECLFAGNIYDDDKTIPDFILEVTQFNQECETAFCHCSFEKLKLYADQMNITAKDAVYYSQQCHCCGNLNEQRTTDEFRPYCSERCRAGIEDYGHQCIHIIKNGHCLICDNMTHDPSDFDGVPNHPCDDCSSELTYPPFEYCLDDLIDDIERINCVCNDCFCRNSKYRRMYFRTYPLKNHPCHNPLVSAIYCCNELQVYNQIDDLQVWRDMRQYMMTNY